MLPNSRLRPLFCSLASCSSPCFAFLLPMLTVNHQLFPSALCSVRPSFASSMPVCRCCSLCTCQVLHTSIYSVLSHHLPVFSSTAVSCRVSSAPCCFATRRSGARSGTGSTPFRPKSIFVYDHKLAFRNSHLLSSVCFFLSFNSIFVVSPYIFSEHRSFLLLSRLTLRHNGPCIGLQNKHIENSPSLSL